MRTGELLATACVHRGPASVDQPVVRRGGEACEPEALFAVRARARGTRRALRSLRSNRASRTRLPWRSLRSRHARSTRRPRRSLRPSRAGHTRSACRALRTGRARLPVADEDSACVGNADAHAAEGTARVAADRDELDALTGRPDDHSAVDQHRDAGKTSLTGVSLWALRPRLSAGTRRSGLTLRPNGPIGAGTASEDERQPHEPGAHVRSDPRGSRQMKKETRGYFSA